MAKGGSKRAATSAPTEEPGAKRVADILRQQGITKDIYQLMLDVVQHPLSGLSDSSRAMILAVLPWSIAVPMDERHEAQAASVRMFEQIVQGVQAELQRAVDVETGRIEELEATKVELDAAVKQSEAAETEARQAVEERTAQLAEAEAVVLQKKTVHRDGELEEKRQAAVLEQTRAQKSALEEVFSNSFVKLKDGTCEEGDAEGLAAAVIAAARENSFEESLVVALTCSLGKRERGAFDEAVINEAEQLFQGKIAEFGEVVEAAMERLAAQVAAVQIAKTELDAGIADQAQAAEELSSAREASSTAAGAAQAAKDAVSELDAKLAIPTTAKSQKTMELQQFCENNVSTFKLLRDRVSQPSKEPAQETVEIACKEPAGEQGANAVAALAGA